MTRSAPKRRRIRLPQDWPEILAAQNAFRARLPAAVLERAMRAIDAGRQVALEDRSFVLKRLAELVRAERKRYDELPLNQAAADLARHFMRALRITRAEAIKLSLIEPERWREQTVLRRLAPRKSRKQGRKR